MGPTPLTVDPYREIERLNWTLAAIGEVHRVLVRAKTEHDLFTGACKALVQQDVFCLAWVGQPLNDLTKTVGVQACAGRSIGFLDELHLSWGEGPLGDGLVGRAIRSRSLQCNNDMQGSPQFEPWRDLVRRWKLQSSFCVPICIGNGPVISTFMLYSEVPDAFGDRELDLMQKLGADIAHGIEALRTKAAYTSALIENEKQDEQLRLMGKILESSTEGVMITDADHNIVAVNSTFTAMTGYRAEDLAGSRPAKVSSRRYGDDFEARICNHLQQSEHWQGEVWKQDINGIEFPTWLKIDAVRSNGAEVTHYIYFLTDITERKKAEEAAIREKLFSDTMMESMPGVFYFYDESGHFLRWNQNFMRVSGYSAAEIATMHPRDFFSPADSQRLEERIAEVFQEGESFIEADFVSKDGSTTPYFFTGKRLMFDGSAYLVGVGVDITKRKRAELASREAEIRFQTLFKLSPVGLAVIDLETSEIIDCNEQAARQLGYTVAEFCRLRVADFEASLSAEGVVARINILRRHSRDHFETQHRTKTGDIRHIAVSAQSIAIGGRAMIECVFHDVTEIKKAQQDLRDHSRRLQAMSRQVLAVQEYERRALVRELHDSVGQELAALSLNLAIIRSLLPEDLATALDARLDDSQRLLEDTSQHIRTLMSELRPPGLEELGLYAALKDHSQRVAQRSGLRLTVSGSEPKPRLEAAAEIALFRIAQEALNNTVKHADATAITLTLRQTDMAVQLVIADDGGGFDLSRPQVFGEYGLGTTTMQERAEAINAELTLESEVGRGTRIVVTVPHGVAARRT